MINYKAENMRDLCDIIGVGNLTPQDPGPAVVSIRLWNGRIVTGTYCSEDRIIDIDTFEAVVRDDGLLGYHLDDLIRQGKSFVVRQGESNDTCTLIWEIK